MYVYEVPDSFGNIERFSSRSGAESFCDEYLYPYTRIAERRCDAYPPGTDYYYLGA